MNIHTTTQQPCPTGKRSAAMLQEPYSSPQQYQRQTKFRRLGSSSFPISLLDSPEPQQAQRLMAGSRSNPIVLGDDADDDDNNNDYEILAARFDPSPNVRSAAPSKQPLFLQLRECLGLLLKLLPADISRQYVFEQCIHHRDIAADKGTHGALIFEDFLAYNANYPKESPESAAMHIPPDSPAEAGRWTNTWKRYNDPALYYFFACNSLAAEFPVFERAYIEYLFVTKGCLYLTYLILNNQSERKLTTASWTAPRVSLAFCGGIMGSPIADPGHVHVQRELAAAVQACQAKWPVPQKQPVAEQDLGFEEGFLSQTTAECLCCFTESPLDQMVSCSGQSAHHFCNDCVNRFVDTLLGDMKCRPVCFAVGPECQAAISSQELRRCLPRATLDLLLDRQLHEDIKNLDIVMAECPFCDYAEELIDPNNSRWLVCKNTKCAKTSCISCRELAHMPLSCEEARAGKEKTDDTLTERHVLEEAMTAALMRKCNKCGVSFVKISGCNSMTCPRSGCYNKQCYLCGSNITDYRHFGKKCTLHDVFDVEDRHRQEVHTAQEAAIVEIRQRNPLISAADLKGKQPMQPSGTRIKQSERHKIQEALALRTHEPAPFRDSLAARAKGSFRLNHAVHLPRAFPPPNPPMANKHVQKPAVKELLGVPNYPFNPRPLLDLYVPPQPQPQPQPQPHLASLPHRADTSWGAEWDAKDMAALRNRLDGIPAPAAAQQLPIDNYQHSDWGRDLLHQLDGTSYDDLGRAAYMATPANQAAPTQALGLPGAFSHSFIQSDRRNEAAALPSDSSSRTAFAAMAARTAMRSDPVSGRYI